MEAGHRLKEPKLHIHAPLLHVYEGSVLSTVESGYFAFIIDLEDAYFHIPIHPGSHIYRTFASPYKVLTQVPTKLFPISRAKEPILSAARIESINPSTNAADLERSGIPYFWYPYPPFPGR